MAVTLRKYGSYGMQCKHVMFFYFFAILLVICSHLRNKPARMVPDMLCQAQLMAQGNTARGWAAKKLEARTVAKPAFCMPTSMEMVRFFAVVKPASRPAVHPKR